MTVENAPDSIALTGEEQGSPTQGQVSEEFFEAELFRRILLHGEVLLTKLQSTRMVTDNQLRLMEIISEGPLGISDIAQILGVRNPSVSTQVSLMNTRGWVRKSPSPFDGRATLIELTEEGQRILKEETDVRLREVSVYFDRIPPEIRAKLRRALQDVDELLLESIY